MNIENKPKKRSRYGIKWKLYGILIAFVGILVGIIWFFQFRMLTVFYQNNKYKELQNTALIIADEIQNFDHTKDIVEDHASDFDEDIWICRVEDNLPKIHIYARATGEHIGNMISSNMDYLYKSAVSNGGTYIALISNNIDGEDTELRIIDDNMGSPKEYPKHRGKVDDQRAIYVTVKDTYNGRFLIVQSAELTPVETVVKTVRNQYLWIGIIMSVVALATAVFISKLITKPMEKMNKSAKRLAKGDYGVDFTVQGYREIDELADTLNYAAEELAKADHLQKELVANVSHDLRTPLTLIKGYSEVMRDIPGENKAENIQIIIDETARLSDLVSDVLDLSRIQSGMRKPDIQEFSLTDTVKETMQRYERLTKQDGYSIVFNAEGDVSVMADRVMILQVVYNLINNAINYTGEDKKVWVEQTVRDDTVRISVTDSGEGISEEQLGAIWDRYYKVDKVHRRATVGTGLGLSIVKQILELHEAKYGVDSTVGEGSTFWFELEIFNDDDDPMNAEYIEAHYEEQTNDEKDTTR